jgi:hypothetical protein
MPSGLRSSRPLCMSSYRRHWPNPPEAVPNFQVLGCQMRPVVIGCDSWQESFPWKRPPYVTLKHNGTVYTFSTGADCPANRQYSRCFREANRGHNITVPDAGTTYPEPFNEAAWRLSQATRAAVYRPNLPDTVRWGPASARTLPASGVAGRGAVGLGASSGARVRMLTTRAGSRACRYYNVYGVNQETPHGLEFEEISSWGELQTAKYTIKMLDGDGASTWLLVPQPDGTPE